MPIFYDTHAHLDYPDFAADFDQVIERAQAAGIRKMISIGTDLDSSRRAIQLAEKFPCIYAVVGWHPSDVQRAPEDIRDALRELGRHPRVVALGETGLDYHYDHSPRDDQRRAFAAQLDLAAAAGKPVVVHAREADDDLAAMLSGCAATVVLHSFTGGAKLFEAGMKIGGYFSFSGMITFKNWNPTVPPTACPPDRLLVETDAPYLAPVPHRGKRNEPAFVRHVAEALARARGETLETIAQRTTGNARRIFGARV
jgi:TatD DNase family protein